MSRKKKTKPRVIKQIVIKTDSPIFDAGDIVLKGVTPMDALDHKNLCQSGVNYLGHYLGWAVDAHNWSLKQHIAWLSRHMKISQPYESYGAFHNDRLVGFFNYSAGTSFLTTQICYYVDRQMAGKGIAKEALETLVQKAFYLKGFEAVELHIDVENIASQKVATRAGFEAVQNYKCSRSGTKGSGHMQLWVKINPYATSGINLEQYRNESFDYLAPAYLNYAVAIEVINTLKTLSEELKGYLAGTGFIPKR